MTVEHIEKIEIKESGKLYVILSSSGKPDYLHIYREAAEVYWDNEAQAFTSPVPRDWTYVEWFNHIVKVTSWIGINLEVSKQTLWVNIPDEVKTEIYKNIIV